MRFLYGLFLAPLVLILVLTMAMEVSGETYVRPDTTSAVMVAAGDSLYALPSASARFFNLNDIPAVETTVAANATIDLGNASRAEIYSFGSGAAAGVYFRVVTSGGTRTVYAHVYIGAADSVRVNAWQY